MVSNRDLMLAVDRGIITREQLDRIETIATDVQNEAALEAQDEAPRFIRSFGDFFIAIGTGFLGGGLSAAVSYLDGSLPAVAAALVLIWLAAEWLTGRLRISAPSIVLAVLFTGFAAYYVPELIDKEFFSGLTGNTSEQIPLLIGVSSLLAAGLFYARFRLPFALAIFGLTVVFLIFAVLGTYWEDFLNSNFRWVIGLSGLAMFVMAMWYDTRDPIRMSLYSDCGFWLHLFAAPMLTHAILLNSHPAISSLQSLAGVAPTSSNWQLVAIFFFIFAFTALIIDRRALLISSLGYVGSIIAYGIWKLDLPADAATSAVLLIIAAIILTFGVGWKPLRRLVLSLLPRGGYLEKLPPVHA